jgi:N-glycosylase/DNA lyase
MIKPLTLSWNFLVWAQGGRLHPPLRLWYGRGFPVDVWIKRIIEHLYFPHEELKPQEAREFGMEKFGDYAGYVQLYLFHYARKSGLLESLRKK